MTERFKQILETLELQCDSIKENVNLQDEYENIGEVPGRPH